MTAEDLQDIREIQAALADARELVMGTAASISDNLDRLREIYHDLAGEPRDVLANDELDHLLQAAQFVLLIYQEQEILALLRLTPHHELN